MTNATDTPKFILWSHGQMDILSTENLILAMVVVKIFDHLSMITSKFRLWSMAIGHTHSQVFFDQDHDTRK